VKGHMQVSPQGKKFRKEGYLIDLDDLQAFILFKTDFQKAKDLVVWALEQQANQEKVESIVAHEEENQANELFETLEFTRTDIQKSKGFEDEEKKQLKERIFGEKKRGKMKVEVPAGTTLVDYLNGELKALKG
jgi:hypothetical protein